MAQKLKFGNGTWATKEGSTLAYNDEGGNYKPLPFTTTRDSIATRVNKEGLIEVVGNDVPRIDYTDSSDGVFLLEKAATNLVNYSSDLSVLSKVSVGTASSPVATANYDIAPDGTMTATRVVFDLNGGNTVNDRSILRQAIPVGSNYYFSIYVKSTNGTEQKVFWHDGGEVTTVTVTNEWKRITYDARTNVSYGGIALNGLAGVDTSDILLWGFQVESNSYPTSYIPTNGSTVQRSAETCNGSGNSEVFNDSQGVLFANIAALSNDGTNRFISLTDGSNDNRVLFGYRAASNQVFARIEGNNSASVDLTNVVSDTEIVIKLAIYYDSSFNYKMYLNGFLVDNAIGTDSIIGLDRFDFTNATGTENFYGKTKELGYYDTALTDEELEYLTSYRTLNELVTELNLNTL